MSMQGLRTGVQHLPTGRGNKGSGGSAFYKEWRPPQIAVGAGMGKDRISFDLKPYLAAPPSEESKVEAAEPVVLIEGSYDDHYAVGPNGEKLALKSEGYHFRAHSFNVFMAPRNPSEKGYNTFRTLVCSSGPDPHAPQPCMGCYQHDHGDKNAKSKDQWAFNIAHLGWYHEVPLVRDGQVVMKKDNSGPVMVKQECLSYKMENVYLGRAVGSGRVPQQIAKKYKECEGCKQKAGFVFGDHRILKLGFKHLKNIFEIDEKVGKKCINCGTGILRVAFDCSKCQNEILDLSQVQWTNDQIDQFSKSPYQCQSCGNNDIPVSAYECGFDDNYNKVAQPCNEPKKTSIFDCVLWLQREGESTESEVVVRRVELIPQFRTQDNRPLQDWLKEIVKETFNLEEMYKAESIEDQCETIRVQNPYGSQQPQYASYGGGQPQFQQPNYVQQGTVSQPTFPSQGYGPGQPQQGGPQPSYPNYPQPGKPNFGK